MVENKNKVYYENNDIIIYKDNCVEVKKGICGKDIVGAFTVLDKIGVDKNINYEIKYARIIYGIRKGLWENGIEIVDKIECKGQSEIAMPELQKIIDEKIYFDNIFCLNDLAGVGVVAALEENNMLNDVDVYGVDASPDSKALIKEGMMKASAVQFPSQIGKKVADVIYKLLNKEDVKKNILMPVELVTKDNIDEFGIGRWQ